VVTAREAEVAAATHGPMGETAGGPLLEPATDGEQSLPGDSSAFEEKLVETKPLILVTRMSAPTWLAGVAPDGAGEGLSAKFGHDAWWEFAVPWMHQALASPSTFEPMPARPDRPDAHPQALGYWAALMQMLFYSLGWARPDRGLRWWYDHGRPVDDPRLALLDQVWGRDGHLEDFARWVCNSTWFLPPPQFEELTGYRDDGLPVEPHPEWRAAPGDTADGSWFDGGSDPYHLSVHTTSPLGQPRGEPLLLRSGRTDRQAVLVLDSMAGWYRALATETTTLPPLDGRSWHVDVVVRPVGWLGTYRRSRMSGLWFAGRHRYHIPGT
jgi:hypothetical protein